MLNAGANFYSSFVSSVALFDGDTLIGQTNTFNFDLAYYGMFYGFQTNWVLPTTGAHILHAVFTDNNGDQYGSETIQFNAQQVGLQLYQTTPMALVGTEKVLLAHVTDAAGSPQWNYNVRLQIAGANPATLSAFTDQFGDAMFVYTGTNAGTDVIEAALYNARASVTNDWVTLSGNRPPVIAVNTNQNAFQNRPFQLAASITDDGLPSGRKGVSPEWRLDKAQNFLGETFASLRIGCGGEDNSA